MSKPAVTANQIADAVMTHFLATGEPIFVSELAKWLRTSAKRISDNAGRDYEYVQADRTSGPWYNTRTATVWAVTPTREALRRMIIAKQERAA